MAVFIGIDPATSCGWAVLNETGERLASGVWKLDARAGDGAGMRYVRLERLFRELLEAYPINARVAYEHSVNHRSGASAAIFGGIVATITRICEELQIPYCAANYATVKKVATGRGNSGKSEMTKAAHARWAPYITTSDDEADALHVAETLRIGAV